MDFPFQSDDAEVGGSLDSIERTQNDDPVAEVEAANDEEPSEEYRPMAWERFEGEGLNDQLARIIALTEFAREQYDYVVKLQDEGIEDDIAPTNVTLGSRDEQVISFALNLVGFFAPDLGPAARELMVKIRAAVDAKVISDEARERVQAAATAAEERWWAEAMGLTIEQYREAKAKAQEREQAPDDSFDVGLSSADGTINLN